MEHEWFKPDLPDHLFPPLGEMNIAQIDSNVIAEVCQKLNVPAADVMAAIKLVNSTINSRGHSSQIKGALFFFVFVFGTIIRCSCTSQLGKKIWGIRKKKCRVTYFNMWVPGILVVRLFYFS